jgi:hypothetical protein
LKTPEKSVSAPIFSRDLNGRGVSGYDGYAVITIEGCEYIQWRSGEDRGGICHKGNCSNPIHQQKKTELNVYVSTGGYYYETREKK